MTLLYYDPIFLQHQTGAHPERPERLQAIVRQLQRDGLWSQCSHPSWQPVSTERLSRIHDPDYIDRVRRFALAGGGRIEVDTQVSSASYDAARMAAGAVCDAVQRVANGEDTTALCLVRPPGHHALRDAAMGFCLFNNVAVGASTAVDELGFDRVMIVDWDVHHGNGTQAAFWSEPRVGFFSIHRFPFYPGSGAEDEIGEGPARGTTLNVPIAFGTSREEYRQRFADGVATLARRVEPQLIFISAGFDSHRDDPIGSLGLETEDFDTLTAIVMQTADTYAEGKIVSVLEGGYNTGVLAGCVETHLRRLLASDSPNHQSP